MTPTVQQEVGLDSPEQATGESVEGAEARAMRLTPTTSIGREEVKETTEITAEDVKTDAEAYLDNLLNEYAKDNEFGDKAFRAAEFAIGAMGAVFGMEFASFGTEAMSYGLHNAPNVLVGAGAEVGALLLFAIGAKNFNSARVLVTDLIKDIAQEHKDKKIIRGGGTFKDLSLTARDVLTLQASHDFDNGDIAAEAIAGRGGTSEHLEKRAQAAQRRRDQEEMADNRVYRA